MNAFRVRLRHTVAAAALFAAAAGLLGPLDTGPYDLFILHGTDLRVWLWMFLTLSALLGDPIHHWTISGLIFFTASLGFMAAFRYAFASPRQLRARLWWLLLAPLSIWLLPPEFMRMKGSGISIVGAYIGLAWGYYVFASAHLMVCVACLLGDPPLVLASKRRGFPVLYSRPSDDREK